MTTASLVLRGGGGVQSSVDPAAWWQLPAVLAALVALTGALVTLAVSGVRARRDRRRDLYAEAFAAVTAYWEYPYIVRRRRHDEPAAERVRISEQLGKVQERISRHEAWIRIENRHVAAAYVELIAATRKIMGPQISEGWRTPAITDDESMNIGTVSRGGLAVAEEAYLEAVRDHLSPWPAWAKRLGRWAWRSVAR
jgi:hypothetical protein